MEPPAVQYVTTSDGYDIAYTISGEGPPLVLTPTPFGHLSNDWQWWKRSLLEALTQRFRLVRYDSRGQGMSSRGLGEGFETLKDGLTVVQRRRGRIKAQRSIGLDFT